MADEKPKQGAMQGQFGGLPLKALIGAPLKAVADANGMLARSQTQFLLSTCFDKDEGTGNMKPKMLKFKIERSMIKSDGSIAEQKANLEFEIPLLTIVPLNSLAVDELNVSFEMEVKSSTEYRIQSEEELNNEAKGEVTSPYHSDKFAVEMHGTLTNTKTAKNASNESGANASHARYDISLHAGKLPLPVGVTTIIDVFSKNIAPIQLKDGDESSSN